MNIIKYLPTKYKSRCIECGKPLIKDTKAGEIYCQTCGFIYLDYTAMTSELIDYAMKIQKKSQKKSQRKSHLTKIMKIDRKYGSNKTSTKLQQ